jgi:hypothetical protein
MAFIQFENVASHGAIRKSNTVSYAPWNNTDLIGPHDEAPELGLDIENAMLRDNEEIAVRRVECFILFHVLPRSVDEVTYTSLGCGIAIAGDQVQRMYPVNCLIEVEWVPS